MALSSRCAGSLLVALFLACHPVPAVLAQQAGTPPKITHVDPIYPEQARQARVQGIVMVQITIGTDGRVTDARVIRSIPLLDQAALSAVRQWVYDASRIKVPLTLTVTVPFGLAASPAAVSTPPAAAPPVAGVRSSSPAVTSPQPRATPQPVPVPNELRRRAEAGNVDAMLELAWLLLADKSPATFGEAARWFQRAGEAGNATGMNNVGWMHEHGIGVARDAGAAAGWYRRAAQAGHVPAMVNLGQLYAYNVLNPAVAEWYFARSRGRHLPGIKPAFVQENDAEALRFFRLAADKGNADAMAEIAHLYALDRAGEGAATVVRPSRPSPAALTADRELLQWANRAATGGSTHGMRLLADYYVNRVVPPDLAATRDWLTRAADRGDAEAMSTLASMHQQGKGFPRPDERTAIQLYQRAAEAGLASAMRMVAYSYFNGTMTLPKNDSEGIRWTRRAVEAGDVEAAAWLEADYRAGARGLPRDPKAARDVWVRLEASPSREIALQATEKLRYIDAVEQNARERGALQNDNRDAKIMVAMLIVAAMVAAGGDGSGGNAGDPASISGAPLGLPSSSKPRQPTCHYVTASMGTVHGMRGVNGGPGLQRVCY
jgi:TonB family protein